MIRRGDAALETYVPQRGALTLETLHARRPAGLVVARRAHTAPRSTRARSATVHAVEFDGRCLRGKCEAGPRLGYDLLTRFVAVIVERLQATRLQLLDVYGHVGR